jgi:hypothetical protein
MHTVLINTSREGNLVSKNIVEGDFKEVVRKTVAEALTLWNLDNADFTVIRDPQYPITAKAPITKEQYDLYSKYDLQRSTNGSVMFYLPVYIISFDNVYLEDSYIDREVLVVAHDEDLGIAWILLPPDELLGGFRGISPRIMDEEKWETVTVTNIFGNFFLSASFSCQDFFLSLLVTALFCAFTNPSLRTLPLFIPSIVLT